MDWIIGGVVILGILLFMGYKSDKRALAIEVGRLASEVRDILSRYKSETWDERPVFEINYLLGFLGGFFGVRLQQLGLKPETIRTHDLFPKIFDQSAVGNFNGGHENGFEIFFKINELVANGDTQFINGNEHGVINAALRSNSLNAKAMSHHLVQSAFKISSQRGDNGSYEAISIVHMELLFNSYAPKSRRLILEIEKEREKDRTPFPFGD